MLKSRKCRLSCVLKFLSVLTLITLILYAIYHTVYKQDEDDSNMFLTFNNSTGSPFKIVPNTVHYIMFGETSLNFISFLSLVSVIKVQECNVWIHCDCREMSGFYWSLVESLSNLTKVPLKLSFMRSPTHVYGQPLSSVYHASDVARIKVLMESGGIYLDTDMVVLKTLDEFLHFEMVVGWPTTEYFGNQIMIGHAKARFLKKYLESYRRYLPREWYYNGGQVPTEEILKPEPHLVHRVPLLFGVHNLVDQLYGDEKWEDWRQYYTIHLLSRHHSDPSALNHTTVLSYHKPFGEIARHILYDTKPTLDPQRNRWLL